MASVCGESAYHEADTEYDESHEVKVCRKFTVSSLKDIFLKTVVFAAYSEKARLVMSGESVTDILKLIS